MRTKISYYAIGNANPYLSYSFTSFFGIKELRVFLILFFFNFLIAVSTFGQRIYLSGTGPDNAIPWDFKISSGKKSGFWTTIPVPSNWEMHGFGRYTYGSDHESYETDPEIGFYKKKFDLTEISGKYFKLTFQGSMTDTHVTINGEKVGSVHYGGYMQFSYDITPYVKEGENLLEVTVHKSSEDKSVQKAERIADFWLFGGIYRPVYIDILPSQNIDRISIDAKMDGAFKMNVYFNGKIKSGIVKATILDNTTSLPIGKPLSFKVSENQESVRIEGNFENIKQWSHEYPHLYRVKVELIYKGKVIHTYFQKFGFRTIEVRDHDGFYLNGKRIILKGAAMHCFRPETGRSLSKKDIEEDFQIQKELNANTVRPCHYPPDDYFFDLCDSLGLLAMCELTGWGSPLNTEKGSILVKEMISRDVNHPCIILWSNGNHKSHNPELDEVFFRWDIQQRRPLRNFARTEEYPGNYSPEFDLVDTRYYPTYDQLKERLAGNRIVCPNETIHALYDGGGAAGLFEFWEAIRTSKVGGGLMIWALFDEGIVRTDRTNIIDLESNRATDGILGPNREKEGSFYAAKDIWSPIQINQVETGEDPELAFNVRNDYTFVNLNQCRINWSLISFTTKDEAASGYRTFAKGTFVPENIPPGTTGILKPILPANWKTYDALILQILDHTGTNVIAKTFINKSRAQLANGFDNYNKQNIIQDSNNPYLFSIGEYNYLFCESTGVLLEVSKQNRKIPVSNFPFLVAESGSQKILLKPGVGKTVIRKDSDKIIIDYTGMNLLDRFTWTLAPNGTLELDYSFTLPPDDYYYSGIGMETDPKLVTGKRWLGNGPYRVWKNRTQGVTMNVWDEEKKVSIPGEVFNYPEFEGFFNSIYWSIIRYENELNMGIVLPENDITLGILNPANGLEPVNAIWHYPSIQGIFFFNCISSVGTKWKPGSDFGSSSKPEKLSGRFDGRIQLNFMWNQNGNDSRGNDLEIE